MSMVLKNNLAAQVSLGELNKNISKLGEALAKVSSGMKINSAQDDSAQFAISEVMRVQIRALSQAMQNVQNGNSLLRTAEDGIQQQIDIMRTIKERVINAANDHNTDADRKIIQKEVNQFYDQMEQTAYYSDYNIQKPLLANTKFNEKVTEWDAVIQGGDYVGKRVTAWLPNLTDAGKAKIVEGSDSLNLINTDNIVDTTLEFLDDGRPYVENGGPFDTFTKVTAATSKTLSSLGDINTGTAYYMAGGSNGANKVISMDFSGYNSVSDLDGLAFRVDGVPYVLSTNPSQYYASRNVDITSTTVSSKSVNESLFPTAPISLKDYTASTYKINNAIDISSCNSFADVATKIKSSVSGTFGDVAVSADDPNKIEFTTKNPNGYTADTINKITITGFSTTGGSISITPATNPLEYTHTNVTKSIPTSTLSVTFSGGQTQVRSDDDPSINITDPATATGSVSLTDKIGNLYYIGGNLIKFVSGSSTTTKSVSISEEPFNVSGSDLTKGTPPRTLVPQNVTITEVGINSSWSFSSYPFTCTVSNGTLNCRSSRASSSDNGTKTFGSSPYTLYFQYKTNEPIISATDTYLSTTAADAAVKQQATDGDFAHYDIDLSKYVGNYSTADLENVIKELKDVNFYISNVGTYSFVDSKILNDLTSPSESRLDLNNLRTSVESGNDIATALQNLFTTITSKSVDGKTPRVEKISSGIRINAYAYGEANNDKGYFSMGVRSNPYYHYDIDFKALFENNADLNMSDLYGKGFMAYCATCPSVHQPDPQWFNFYFTDHNLSPPISVPKPDIDTDEDIKNIPIDVSEVEDGDYEGLIQAIYSQATPILNSINHHMFLSGDTQNGILTLYDKRTSYSNPSEVRHGQQGTYGAIIMDGYKDTSIPVTEDYYEDRVDHQTLHSAERERRFVIQDTDHSDLNITLHIPSTTLKDIFQDWCFENKENSRKVWEYNLTSKKDREALLGDDSKGRQGAIDSALEYLLDAAVMVGAQRARLETSSANLTTQVENDMAAESTIRDADMAKEMAEYTKFNVLSQSAQAMLAQANQSSSQILSLLQ